MQRISISGPRIRRFSVTSVSSSPVSIHVNVADHRMLNQILGSCKISSNPKCVLQTHAQIVKLGYGRYPSLVASMVSAYRQCNLSYSERRLLLRFLLRAPGLVNTNLLIENLMKVGEYGMARKVFRKMTDRDLLSWNLMISGNVKNCQYEDALRIFRKMFSSDLKPDKFTFASALASCARLGDLHHAKWVHRIMIDAGIELNPILSSALVDVYAKCGDIEASKEIFNSVQRNDVSIWNSMINGLATHGLASDAVTVFSEMAVENVSPDSITFLGLYTACSHCGLLKEGKEDFDLMSRRYLIQPKLEHYGAMVDLLCRAGMLQDAYDMIASMPVEPDIVIWRSLLSSSRTYKNSELGEIAVNNISRLRSGDYVLLSNIYSSTKRWESAEKVRELMKNKGVRKTKGKSWVELGGAIHRFKAGDSSHPEMKAIYRVLEGLIQKTKLEGFVPDTDLVLMDVSEEEKEENLRYHSEKIALAYGILKSSPGSNVRIHKNLRICCDCHSWIKSVSKLLNRVVIVRDLIRFHRFEDGSCSCRDYW
ncbi:PREDICTED: pentatricopeptide repeat-containing protein At5g50990 [Tarenaya hassleriana]|uniref:pentatricopeptide repeat-containing protein At5g50990 n=1 Tax=Tarenaya hassleriana TaxID=28532 RepID=UPI00053C1875|nr:PREDICTED: pentatricopeptide repeat-containing protein At5g50990 [Tarenaya hassleriana]